MNRSITYERRGKMLSISLQRPDKKNSLTTEMYKELTRLFVEADQDDAVRVIHITGSGNSFCAGNDIKDFLDVAQHEQADIPARLFLQQLHRQRKPVVAAVNGLAIGIGVTMLLHFDLVYAASAARFKVPFVDLGLVPEGGSSRLLPQLLGHRHAAELLLLGEEVDAESAAQMGIVNGVYPTEQLLAQSEAMAQRLAEKPPRALQQTKAMMKRNPGRPMEEVIDSEVDQLMRCLTAEEAQTALRAFIDRR